MILKVIRRLQAFSSAIRLSPVQHFTRFQLTACSRGPSATAGLLVKIISLSESAENLRKFAVIHQDPTIPQVCLYTTL